MTIHVAADITGDGSHREEERVTGTGAAKAVRGDDHALLDAVRVGDDEAFAILFDRHVQPVRAYARSRAADPADADDLVQAAFVLLWEKRRILELAGDSLLPWLLVSVRLLAQNANRSRRRRVAVSTEALERLPASTGGPEQTAESADRQRRIDRAIAALDPVDREIVGLCLASGLSYADAAARLGLTVGSVRGRLMRLRRRLRAELAILKGDR